MQIGLAVNLFLLLWVSLGIDLLTRKAVLALKTLWAKLNGSRSA